MKKKILMILFLVLLLTGCKTVYEVVPDTIVDIPLHPTEAETQPDAAPTEAVTQPEETEPPTQAPTEAPTDGSTSGGKTTGGKTPGKSGTGQGNSGTSKPAATEPPTQPPTVPPTEPSTEVPAQPPSYDPAGYTPGSLDRAIAEAVNARRQAAGLEALPLDTRLCAIASVRAREVFSVWGTTRPDGSAGISVLGEYGYSHSSAAENLYFGTAGAGTIVDKWMSSEARKANILMESAAAIGVGSYTDEDGITYVSVLFAG